MGTPRAAFFAEQSGWDYRAGDRDGAGRTFSHLGQGKVGEALFFPLRKVFAVSGNPLTVSPTSLSEVEGQTDGSVIIHEWRCIRTDEVFKLNVGRYQCLQSGIWSQICLKRPPRGGWAGQ